MNSGEKMNWEKQKKNAVLAGVVYGPKQPSGG